jgi:hypothetical protein
MKKLGQMAGVFSLVWVGIMLSVLMSARLVKDNYRWPGEWACDSFPCVENLPPVEYEVRAADSTSADLQLALHAHPLARPAEIAAVMAGSPDMTHTTKLFLHPRQPLTLGALVAAYGPPCYVAISLSDKSFKLRYSQMVISTHSTQRSFAPTTTVRVIALTVGKPTYDVCASPPGLWDVRWEGFTNAYGQVRAELERRYTPRR